MSQEDLKSPNIQSNPPEPQKQQGVGFKDQSGAVIVRPEDVYGKVDTGAPLEKVSQVSPVPTPQPITAPVSVNTSTNTVPNFPTMPAEPIISSAPLNSLENDSIDSSLTAPETKVPFVNLKEAPMVGMSGSDLEKRHLGAQSLGIMRVFLIFMVFLLLFLGILALDFYFEVSLGGSLIYKFTGFNIVKTFLGL